MSNYFLAAILVGSTAFAGNVAQAATVAHWRFEEGTPGQNTTSVSNILLDSSSNGFHATAIGAPVFVASDAALTDMTTVGLKFSGNQQVFVSDSPAFALTQSLTVEAFVRVDSLANPQRKGIILERGDTRPGLDPYQLHVGSLGSGIDGQIAWEIHDEAGSQARILSPQPVSLGETIHVAGTLNDVTGEMSLFINGTLVTSTVTTVRPLSTLDPNLGAGVQIGSVPSGQLFAFNGVLDEVRISDRALTPSEFINQSVPEPSTVALGIATAFVIIGYAVTMRHRRRRQFQDAYRACAGGVAKATPRITS